MLSAGPLVVAALSGVLQAAEPSAGIPASDPLVADSVLVIPNGPVLITERAGGLPVLGIHISAPLSPFLPGTARVLLDQALSRARQPADAIGASLWGGIENSRLSLRVVGNLADADEIAWIARRLLHAPTPDGTREALNRYAARVDRFVETPQGRLALALEGTGEASDGRQYAQVTNYDDVHELWRRSHARSLLRIVVLGDVSLPQLLSELSLVGAPSEGWRNAGGGPGPGPPPATETPLYSWSAAVFSLGPTRDPAAVVGVAALAAGIRETDFPARVRLIHSVERDSVWVGISAQARRQRDADNALAGALALMADRGLAPWWQDGIAKTRRQIVADMATPGGWLGLTDRYYDPSRPAPLRELLASLDALGTDELDSLAACYRSTLSRPPIDR